jgi:hypothetical protein
MVPPGGFVGCKVGRLHFLPCKSGMCEGTKLLASFTKRKDLLGK